MIVGASHSRRKSKTSTAPGRHLAACTHMDGVSSTGCHPGLRRDAFGPQRLYRGRRGRRGRVDAFEQVDTAHTRR